MSPRWFRRRTYRIVASGRSALTFNAAMSASSASTTIRSAFLLTLSPTVNCQDILAFRKAQLGCERRASASTQPCEPGVLLCLGVVASRRTQGARLYAQIANGADAGLMLRSLRASLALRGGLWSCLVKCTFSHRRFCTRVVAVHVDYLESGSDLSF